MTTLLAQYTNDGCIGRCDAKCYGATKPKCNCICGGANHGVGYRQALEQTKALPSKTPTDHANALRDGHWTVNFAKRTPEPLNQLTLLDCLETPKIQEPCEGNAQ